MLSLMNKNRLWGLMLVLLSALLFSACSIKKAEKGKSVKERTNLEGTAKKFGNLKDFACKTLDGKKFELKDLKAYDLTILNFWSTWCGPCVEEMPELADFAAKLPENVQFVTVCLDGDEAPKEAKAILKEAGFRGRTIVSGEGDFLIVCDRIQYTPTTVLVDSEGNLIGDEMVGVQEDTEKAYLSYVNNALKQMDKEEISFEK